MACIASPHTFQYSESILAGQIKNFPQKFRKELILNTFMSAIRKEVLSTPRFFQSLTDLYIKIHLNPSLPFPTLPHHHV